MKTILYVCTPVLLWLAYKAYALAGLEFTLGLVAWTLVAIAAAWRGPGWLQAIWLTLTIMLLLLCGFLALADASLNAGFGTMYAD